MATTPEGQEVEDEMAAFFAATFGRTLPKLCAAFGAMVDRQISGGLTLADVAETVTAVRATTDDIAAQAVKAPPVISEPETPAIVATEAAVKSTLETPANSAEELQL